MAFLSTKVIQKVPFFSDKQHNNKNSFSLIHLVRLLGISFIFVGKG